MCLQSTVEFAPAQIRCCSSATTAELENGTIENECQKLQKLFIRKQGMAPIRIVLVDDSPDWQRFLLVRLESERDLKLLAVANDGLEGVQKAVELQPDVMLMDLNMPVMNGFDAARRIREVSPNSRVVFLTANSSGDLVSAAFEAGACGYILKSDSGADLVPGIQAVFRNKQFLSRSLRVRNRT